MMSEPRPIDARGWIKVSRKLLDNPLFSQKPHSWLTVWMALLLNANWKEGIFLDGVETTVVPVGSLVTSEENLATHTRTSRQTIRSVFSFLEATQAATFKRTKRWTMITITNWAAYQATSQSSEPTEQPTLQPSDGPLDPAEITHETTHGVTTIEEVKNLRKEHMSKSGDLDSFQIGASPKTKARANKRIDPDTCRWFDDQFWPLYPRHEAKGKALEAAGKKATTPEKRAFYLERLRGQLPEYKRRKAGSGQRVIPLGSTWFNQDRAEDELPVEEPTIRGGQQTSVENDYPEYQPLREQTGSGKRSAIEAIEAGGIGA